MNQTVHQYGLVVIPLMFADNALDNTLYCNTFMVRLLRLLKLHAWLSRVSRANVFTGCH